MTADTMQDEFLLVMTTCPTKDSATELAKALVEAKIAACIQISASVTSIYSWEDDLCEESEFALHIKCMAKNYSALENKVKQLHPYQVPELIAVSLTNGLPAYFDWIKETTTP